MRLVVNHHFMENSIFDDVYHALVEVRREKEDESNIYYAVKVCDSARYPCCVIATSDIEKAFQVCDQINDAICSGQELLEVTS